MKNAKALEKKIEEQIKNTTPGVLVQAYVKGQQKINLAVGDVCKYYDLASLTKVVCSVSLLMSATDQKTFDPSKSVSQYIPWFQHKTKASQLLSHSAGFPWWIPLYQKISSEFPRFAAMPLWERSFILEKILRDQKPKANQKAIYSDVDFFFLKTILQNIYSQPINASFDALAEKIGLRDTYFHVNNRPKHKISRYAPTEKCPWRKKVLRGEVHDENTWSLGGVSSHAGLFGGIDDLSHWALQVRKSLRGQNGPWSSATAKKFTKRAIPESKGDWTLGFMMPSQGASSSGQYFSRESFGHTGFTGTSIWFDPKKDFIVAILSNRVHPTRKNENFKKLRPLIHDWCYEFCWS